MKTAEKQVRKHIDFLDEFARVAYLDLPSAPQQPVPDRFTKWLTPARTRTTAGRPRSPCRKTVRTCSVRTLTASGPTPRSRSSTTLSGPCGRPRLNDGTSGVWYELMWKWNWTCTTTQEAVDADESHFVGERWHQLMTDSVEMMIVADKTKPGGFSVDAWRETPWRTVFQNTIP